MRKHATTINTPDGTTVLVDLLIATPAMPVSTPPRVGGGWLSLRPRGA